MRLLNQLDFGQAFFGYIENVNELRGMGTEIDQPVIAQQPVAVKESDTSTVVSFEALTLPTPDKVKAIFKMITFFTVVAGVVLNGISEIPIEVKRTCGEYILVTILVLQKAEDFFGIKIDEPKK